MFFSNSADQNFIFASIRSIIVTSEVGKTILPVYKTLAFFVQTELIALICKKNVDSGYLAKWSQEFRKLITIEVNQIMTCISRTIKVLYIGMSVRLK